MSTSIAKSGNVQNGLIWGIIIGLVYCISLFVRYNFLATNVIMLSVLTFVFYLGVLGLLTACGLKRRRELGGFITLKEAFQTIFVAILIAELIYAIFNFIYLAYIDPNYFDKFYAGMEAFLEKSNMDDARKEETLDKMREQMDTQKEKGISFQGIAFSYLISVCITGVFGFVISLIIRKKPAVFSEPINPA